jgi:hypothetical protein
MAEYLNLGEPSWSKPNDEDIVRFLDIDSTYCADATRGRFYDGSFLEGEFGWQGDDRPSHDVELWDSEVFREAARVDVTLLEIAAESEVPSRAVSTVIARNVMVRYDPVARLAASYVVRDFFDCAADFVA